MVFSSFLFLFLFLPVVCLLYFGLPRALRNSTLLLSSIIFYGWGAPQVVGFLLIGSLFDFFCSPWIVPGALSPQRRRALFTFAVIANLSALLYYKYFNFAAAEISRLFIAIGVTPLTWTSVVLPIGISFFTFHKISYLGDVYRGKVSPSRSAIDYCLYILFFPQLIAGPIIRYADVAGQFQTRVHSLEGVFEGLSRFCFGLGKKVLIADSLGAVVDPLFALKATQLSVGTVWLAAFCYSLQIFFDFSGYSDMAIGLAKVFGFSFRENFDRPYQSHSFTEFWRRWHISLSTFMREYVYIPLGGNRGSEVRMHINLWATFLLSGLWHGASWNFLVWGAYHGAFLTLDRLGWQKISDSLPRFIPVLLTFVLVTIGWVFFRAETLHRAFELLAIMIGFGSSSAAALPRAFIIDNRSLVMLLCGILICFAPKLRGVEVTFPRPDWMNASRLSVKALCALLLLSLSAAALASRGYTPFLYFRF
jgi:alginate O-acetyltransferase complex protein AlgI